MPFAVFRSGSGVSEKKNQRSPSGSEIFKWDWKFQASRPTNPYLLWWLLKVKIENFRSLGTTPISGKTLSEWKGHSRSSRRVPGYSRSSSRNWKFHSRNTKFHSRNGLSRLDQYETHNSRSNSRSDPRNCREPTRKIFICPCILGAFFQELGWSPRTRKFQVRLKFSSELWKCKSWFSNHASVKTIFEALECLQNSVFEVSKWVSTKTLLLKHYRRRQGRDWKFQAVDFIQSLGP